MGFKVALINLPIVHVTGDPFGDIPFMPTGTAYLAGYLRDNGVDVKIIDAFGLAPRRYYRIDDQLSAVGLTHEEIVERLAGEDIVGMSIHSGMSHGFALRLAAMVREALPHTTLVAGGHHPSVVYGDFLAAGVDCVCIGEGEAPLLALVRALRDGKGDPQRIPGLAWAGIPPEPAPLEQDLDRFGFAALDLLPLENYWSLGMSHAPVRGRYMVISTSRGCPYGCRFCTTPQLLGRKWRTRSPEHIVTEIERAAHDHGITDVIIQDEVFGVRKEITLAIAREIVARDLHVRLYLPSGVKAETFDEETLDALRKAGLEYLCLAPESGSARVLEKMGKPMDFKRLYKVIKFARKSGIRMGAFFILGFEDENDEDRRLTRDLLRKLTRMGVDEVSIFIWTPLPGADAFASETGWTRYEDLNWSPSWRGNFARLRQFRSTLFRDWLVTKALCHPLDITRSAVRVLTGRYSLKSEMAVRRILGHVWRRMWPFGETRP
jgi:radical SAM superfamily enzyme YgiQ (UPF0313 family)